MSLADVFATVRAEDRAAFIAYLPAGYPTVEGSIDNINAVVAAGADVIEVGLPYSDPMMDGPTIQEAADIALDAGFRIKDLFQFYPPYQDLEELREYASAADHRHWERVAERRSERPAAAASTREGAPAPYYLRFLVTDAPGVLAKVAAALGDAGISINRMRQVEHAGEEAPILIVTHAAERPALDRALATIAGLDVCRARPVAIRVEEI